MYAEIENGKIKNIIEAAPEFINDLKADTGLQYVDVTGIETGIGCSFDGVNFSKPKKAKRRYEFSFDKNANAKKIFVDGKAKRRSGEEYEWIRNTPNAEGKLFYSNRGNDTKQYYKPSRGEDVKTYLPDIVLLNAVTCYYSELTNDQGSVTSREWYFGFKTREEMEFLYKSLEIPVPTGAAYDNYVNDPENYGYSDANMPTWYKFFVSVEYDGTNTSIDFYSFVSEEEKNTILEQFVGVI